LRRASWNTASWLKVLEFDNAAKETEVKADALATDLEQHLGGAQAPRVAFAPTPRKLRG
jgi:hypothetical protein